LSQTTEALLAKERIYVASQWQLMWWRFRKHKPALGGGAVLIVIYLCGIFARFLSPYDPFQRGKLEFCPPQRVYFSAEGSFSLRPFVYALKAEREPVTLRKLYTEDRSQRYPVYFFVHASEYKFLGLFRTDLHLFGVEGASIHLLGTDDLGRDLFSRILRGGGVSLSVGLLGMVFSFVLGCVLGGISGYYGGTVDVLIQRAIEFLRCIPTIPLWMTLSAALPPHWPATRVYIGLTAILSLVGWTGLARVVRGKLLQLKEEDYVMAARLVGSSDARVIFMHLLTGFVSYLIVRVTLSIPGMILGETALSFLGLGLRPPVVSWGVLLQQAQNVRTVALHPWLLLPALLLIVVVLSFNFVGDALRDAADPYGG
jgi:peptide/nickel transport system permease protein